MFVQFAIRGQNLCVIHKILLTLQILFGDTSCKDGLLCKVFKNHIRIDYFTKVDRSLLFK